MSRRTNLINYIITMAVTLSALFAVVFICNSRYNEILVDAMVKFLVGALVAGLIHTFAHELGHLISGKRNGFVFSAMTVWFFRWYKQKNKIKFHFVMIGEEAGYTEMIPENGENIDNRFKKMSAAGPLASLIFTLVGIPVLFIPSISVWAFCILAMFLPIGAYFFLYIALPASNYGVRNDGAIVYGINHNEDTIKVALNLLKIQAQTYQGKTPSQVDKELYFDLPQLPEDDLNFIMLLNARYLYYLDCEDLLQMCRLVIMRLYRNGYYIHKRLVRRAFNNEVLMHIRKDKNKPIIVSVNSTVYEDDSDDELTLLDTLPDTQAILDEQDMLDEAAKFDIIKAKREIIVKKIGQRQYDQLVREYGNNMSTGWSRKLVFDLHKYLESMNITSKSFNNKYN